MSERAKVNVYDADEPSFVHEFTNAIHVVIEFPNGTRWQINIETEKEHSRREALDVWLQRPLSHSVQVHPYGLNRVVLTEDKESRPY